MFRNTYIDFLKGCSILGVIIIHTLLLVPKNNDHYFHYSIIDSFFRFAVPMFIAILGYMTVVKYTRISNWRTFYHSKFIVLLIPYLLWSSIYTLTPRVFPDYQKKVSFLESVIFGTAEIHLYFMIAYFLFLFITPIVVIGLKILNKKLLSYLLIVLAIFHLFLLFQTEISIRSGEFGSFYIQLSTITPIHWLSFYVTGIFVAIHKEFVYSIFARVKKSLVFTLPVTLPLYFALILIFVATKRNLYNYFTPFLYLIFIGAATLLTIQYSFLCRTIIGKCLIYIGKNSFVIYLSHVLWIKLGYIWFERIDLFSLTILALLSVLLSCAYAPLHNFVVSNIMNLYNDEKC